MTRLHPAALAILGCCLMAGHVPVANAQPAAGSWPRCNAERDGQQVSHAGSVCECSYERGGSLIGKPPGWRWSCDILRSDGSNLAIPPDTGFDRQSLPPGFTYVPQTGAAMQPTQQDPYNAPYNAPYDPRQRRSPNFDGWRR